MAYKNKKDRIENSLKYYYENRAVLLRKKRKYRLNNIEKFKEKDRKYFEMNKEKRKLYAREWCKKNRKYLNIRTQKRRRRIMKSWLGFIPKEIWCECCGRKIYFKLPKIGIKKDFGSDSIHFDHRLEGLEPIKSHPGNWLRENYCTEKNKKIWESCDFGMLCRQCNGFLFTKNRKEKLIRIIKYVFGEENAKRISVSCYSDNSK